MAVVLDDDPLPEAHAPDLMLLSKAVKSLDTAMLRFSRAVLEMHSAVGAISSALERITACTVKLPLNKDLEAFNALCLSMQNCVAGLKDSDVAKTIADNDMYHAAHKDLEALRKQTEGLAASAKARARARDKWTKYHASPRYARKAQQYEERLGTATAELCVLQRRYAYTLPNTLCDVLHRILRGSSQFCRSLGTTLLCCGNESRRYSEALQLSTLSMSMRSLHPEDHPETTAALTEEQQKGLALQHFAKDLFLSAHMKGESLVSLSGFCDQDRRDVASRASGSTSGCTTSRLVDKNTANNVLWTPVEIAVPEGDTRVVESMAALHVPPVSRCDLAARIPGCASAKDLLASERTDHPSLLFPQVRRRRVLSQPLLIGKATVLARTPSTARHSLDTLGEVIQLEQDRDCPF